MSLIEPFERPLDAGALAPRIASKVRRAQGASASGVFAVAVDPRDYLPYSSPAAVVL